MEESYRDKQGTPATSSIKPVFFYGFVVVAAALFIMIVTYSTRSAFGIFFKPMLTDFGWTRALTSGALSVSMLVQGSLAVVMGGFSDRFGPRIVLMFCCFLVGLGYLLMSRIGAIWQLYLFFGVMIGVGMGGVFVPLLSSIARWFVARRNMMSGIVIAGIGVSGLIAPPVANWLISAYDWRLSCIVLGITVWVIGILAAQFLKHNPAQIGQLPFGENKRGEAGFKAEIRTFSIREAMRTSQFWMVFTMFFCVGFCLYAIMVHIAPHATDLGISATTAANILASLGGASIIGNIAMGAVADKIGNRWSFFIGFMLMALTQFGLMLATGEWMLYLLATVFGFASSGCVTSESPIVARLYGISSHGSIFGVISFSFTIGAAAGPLATGYIFDFTGSYDVAFLVSVVISIVGFVLALFLRPVSGGTGRL